VDDLNSPDQETAQSAMLRAVESRKRLEENEGGRLRWPTGDWIFQIGIGIIFAVSLALCTGK
jgi:hypothetical protein